MLASPKYVITYLIMRLILVLLVCPCVASSLTKNGYLAVGAIQRNVSMNWQINTTGISSNRFVLHPSGSTVIFFPANSVLGNVAAAFANRVRDVGNVSQSIVSFSLLSLTVADAGRYFYKIFPDTDAGGQDLVIAGYPANVSIKEVSPPYENKQYKLQCSAESTSVPLGMGLTMLYQWKRENGQNITVSDRYSFSSDQSNLIINSVKKEDNGTVVCEAWEHVEAVSQSAPFLVKVILEQGNKTECDLELGLGLGHGFGIPIVITVIVVVIFIYTAYTYPCYRGLGLGLGLGIAFQVSWIIIVSLISTGITSCKLELGLGLVLVLGMLCVIAYIIAVIFKKFSFSLFKDIPTTHEFCKGIIQGLIFASVIGYIVYLIYDKLKRKHRCTAHEDNPQETDGPTCEDKPPEPNGKKPEQVQLKLIDTKDKTKNPGSSSAVSREQVQVQMENNGVKDDDEERPTTVHTRTQNKFDPNTNSKQTNDRQQPVPPANTVFEDTPTFRPLPQPPQNIKDRNQRGISATIDDTSDLASETPRPNKLPPLTPKQTVQKEDVSEEPKKKKKKKKKKDQMNVETPEEENGETDLMVN